METNHETQKLSEEEKIIKNFFRLDATLKSLPAKESKKIVVLKHLLTLFEAGKQYSESEINALLIPVYEDHVQIRRALIDYKLLERSQDCRLYWKKQISE